MKSLQCPICYCTYDLEDNIPNILFCGHTLCIICIQKIKTKKFANCPFDRTKTKFVKNFALIEILQEKQKQMKCLIHQKKIKFQLKNDYYKYLCSQCLLNKNKKEYQKVNQKQIKQQIQYWMNQLQDKEEFELTKKLSDIQNNKNEGQIDQILNQVLLLMGKIKT